LLAAGSPPQWRYGAFLIGRDWAYRLPILVLFDEADVADQTAGVNSAIEHLLPANTNPLS